MKLSWTWEPRLEKELSDLVLAKDLSIIFIAKTLANEARLKRIKRNLDFENMFFIPRINRGGGLVLLWRNYIEVDVEIFSKNHIDSIINKGKEVARRFTGFLDSSLP